MIRYTLRPKAAPFLLIALAGLLVTLALGHMTKDVRPVLDRDLTSRIPWSNIPYSENIDDRRDENNIIRHANSKQAAALITILAFDPRKHFPAARH